VQTRASWLVTLALATAAACASVPSDSQSGAARSQALPAVEPAPGPVESPVLPRPATEFAATQVHVVQKPNASARTEASLGSKLADVEGCAVCHEDAAAQWRTSAHAFGSFNNPVYRSAVLAFRKRQGNEKSQFCAGCHDIALLVDGAMQKEIDPADARAFAGVTCRTCHGIVATRPDGNGSYDLSAAEPAIPKDGDPASIRAHKASVAGSTLRTAELCGSCHRAFLDESTGTAQRVLVGQDDFTPWMRSAYAGSHAARIDSENLTAKDCRGCHMNREPAIHNDAGAKQGTIASHRFLGGNAWLAKMRGDHEAESKIEKSIRESVSLQIAAIRNVGAAAELQTHVDVVIKNEAVGHRFPGGVGDVADTWIEMTVRDAQGRTLGASGTKHADDFDDDAHVLTAYVADSSGRRLLQRETDLFHGGVYNQTLAPREAVVVRYALASALGPITVQAKLRYRTRAPKLQELACTEFRTERGKAFGRGGIRHVARNLDPCKPQPIITVGETSQTWDATSGSLGPAPKFERTFAYGQGLMRSLQEHLDDARPVFAEALRLAGTPREKAMVMSAMANLAAHQGKKQETEGWVTQASALGFGTEPALAMARAEPMLAQWDWIGAAAEMQRASVQAPKDDSILERMAIALGGAGRSQEAYRAAGRGLLLQPRDPGMLRVQSLAFDKLWPASAEARSEAHEAFLKNRLPDDVPAIRGKCSMKVAGCANERIPLHTHRLTLE
jgi:Cytochrome c554 and c-prime